MHQKNLFHMHFKGLGKAANECSCSFFWLVRSDVKAFGNFTYCYCSNKNIFRRFYSRLKIRKLYPE